MVFATRASRALLCLAAVATLLTTEPHVAAQSSRKASTSGALAPAFVQSDGRLTPGSSDFVAVGGGRPIFFTSRDVRMVDPQRRSSLWLTFVGARATMPAGDEPTGGRVNFLRGDSAPLHRVAYRDVAYRDLWPGIDLRFTGVPGGLEYTIDVKPGADPGAVRLRYRGADRVALNAAGELRLATAAGEVIDRAPETYQRIGGRRIAVDAKFVVQGDEVGFAVGAYDHTRPLVIDPTIVYSTYLGSSGYDAGHAIAVDSAGAAYVTGTTRYVDFPTTPGAFQTTFAGGTGNSPSDAFVVKINPQGTAFAYATYLGGSGNDEGLGIAVDASGNAYVTGYTESANFPTTSGAYSTTIGTSNHDGFVTKLNVAGSALVYSTFFGTNGSTQGASIAVDSVGNAYVTGFTESRNLPVTLGGNQPAGARDAYLIKLNVAGSQIAYNTYLGGAARDEGTGVAVDSSGHAFVSGWTQSLDGIVYAQVATPVQPYPNSASFLSTDGGQTFQPSNTTALHPRTVNGTAIDPQQPATMYEATTDLGILKSIDGGTHWTQVNNGLGSNVSADRIVINPNTPTTLLADANSSASQGFIGVFRSTDGGSNWAFVAFNTVQPAFAPSDPSIAYARGNNLMKSVDGGASWTATSMPGGHSFAIDPTNPSIVYVGHEPSVVLKTTDGGATYTSVTLPGSSAWDAVSAMAVDPTNTNVVWAGCVSGRVFKSTDAGASWTLYPAAALAYARAMAFDGGTLYIADSTVSNTATAAIWKTVDGGATWTALKIRGNVMDVFDLTVHNGTILVGSTAHIDGFLYKIDTNATTASLMYGTYIGGSLDDYAVGVSLDPSGNPAVVVKTTSADFPTTVAGTPHAVALARLTSNGSGYAVSTFIGPVAPGVSAAGIAVDGNYFAYATGAKGDTDPAVWIDRVDQSGTVTDEFTLNGQHSNVGVPADVPAGIAAGGGGTAYVTGSTTSIDFPTTPGAPQPTYGSGASDAFVSKLSFGSGGGGGGGGGLPSPWVNRDIGTTGLPGSASYSNGVFTVAGAGADIWGTTDSFQYVYQPINGDATIVARVVGEQNTSTYAKAGIMLRETLDPASAHVLLDLRPDGSVELMTRRTAGGSTTFLAGGTQPFPGWLRLVRSGATITASVSGDGTTWSTIGSTTTSMGSSIEGGLAVTSHDTSVTNTASFDNVAVTTGSGGGLPAPWTDGDVGSTGLAGSASYSSGAFTVQAAGADIWGTADSFNFVSQSLSGDGQIVAHVTALQNTNTYAKGGVMFRDGTAANAADAILDVKPDGCIEFMSRPTTGAATTYIASGSCGMPMWLKLVRSGSTFTAFWSSDGSAWQQLGSAAPTIGSTATVGLAVTSHNTSALTTATFDNVSVTSGSGGGLPAPWTDGDVGSTGVAGSAAYASGVFTVKAAGADIWGAADSFNFVSQPLTGDGQIVARVTGLQNTNTYAKGGVMFRDGAAADAADVILDVKPDGCIEFMSRPTTGANTSYIGSGNCAIPQWLKLVRSGSTFTASWSTDGSTWQAVGSTTATIGSTAAVGLAATSHDTSALTTATFDNVTVTAGAVAGTTK